MKDEENGKERSKLLTIENIETTTRNIWRLSTVSHTAICLSVIKSLPDKEAEKIDKIMSQQHPVHKLEKQFGTQFKKYIEDSCSRNATFCLHKDMMKHCDEIIAIAVAERIGGLDRYKMLLASVKSLLFSFLNGSSSHAGCCSRPLLEHYLVGHSHSNFKTRSIVQIFSL